MTTYHLLSSTEVGGRFVRHVNHAHLAMVQLSADLERALASAMPALIVLANDPVLVDGLCAKYFVRGSYGLATEAELDAEVRMVLTGDGETAVLYPENRALVATALLRGWVQYHDEPASDVLCWHRPLGGLAVEVGRG